MQHRGGSEMGTLGQLFEQMLGHWPMPVQDLAYARLWDFDVSDEENQVIVRAELPGFEAHQINVQIHENTLTIEAEQYRQTDGEDDFRTFHRSVMLPARVDADRIEATYHNGVLELRMPKTEEARAKRIPVRDLNPARTTSAGARPVDVKSCANAATEQQRQQMKGN
jgi:HSP20 family protein